MTGRYKILREKLNRLRAEILLHGPMTLYGIQKSVLVESKRDSVIKSKMPASTIDRHLNILLDQGEIIPYETEAHRSGHTKTSFGLTLYGFIRSFRIPGRIAKKNTKQALEIWLREEKFTFFLPKEEVLNALQHKDTQTNLARLCQMIADMLPEAEELTEYLEGQGYSESNPSQIIEFAIRFAGEKYYQEFVATSKVLCKYLPTYKERIRQFIQAQRTGLDSMEKYIFGDLKREEI